MDVFWTILVIVGLVAMMVYGFASSSAGSRRTNAGRESFKAALTPKTEPQPTRIDEIMKSERVGLAQEQVKKPGKSSGFSMTHSYTGDTTFIAADSTSGKFAYGFAPQYTPKIVPAKRIISVTVYEDGRSISHAHRGRQVGAAIVGSLVAGQAGAIIGGLGAKPKSIDAVNQIVLRIELDDPDNPILDIDFLHRPAPKGGANHEGASYNARTWSSLITAMMRKSEQHPTRTEVTAPAGAGLSQTEEGQAKKPRLKDLEKLVHLRDKGVLTPEEFEKEKARILRSEG